MLVKENWEKIRKGFEKASEGEGEQKKDWTLYHPMFPKSASPIIPCVPSITTLWDREVASGASPEIHKSEKQLNQKTFSWHKCLYEYHDQLYPVLLLLWSPSIEIIDSILFCLVLLAPCLQKQDV